MPVTNAETYGLSQDQYDMLETLMDRKDLRAVTRALAQICRDKAEHVESAWQDKLLARVWARNASKLDKTADQLQATA